MGAMRATIDWIVIIAAGALVAAITRAALPWLANAQGGFGPTLLNAVHPGAAMAAMGAVIVVLCVVAVGAHRRVGPLHAMGAVGAGLGWGALGLDDMRSIIVEGGLGVAAVDGIIWAVIVLALSSILLRRVASVEPDVSGGHPDPLASAEALRAAVIGVIAGLLAAWLLTRTELRQQTAIAAVAGGFACGFAGRLTAPHVQPVLLPAAMIVGGTLAAWVMGMLLPVDVDGAVARGAVSEFLLPLPIDWAAGAMFGVPMGFAAGHGLLKHDDDDGDPAAERRAPQ